MTPATVVIVGADRDLRGYGPAGRTLWYFGNDYRRYLQVRAAWPPERVADAGKALNAVAIRLSPQLTDLDAILASDRFPISWLSSDLAERNPYTSSFCLDVCRGVALVEAARGGGTHLAVVEDAPLGRALVGLCRANGVTARWEGPRTGWRWMPKAGRAHAGFLLRWFAQRMSLRGRGPSPRALAGRDLLLMSWADGSPRGDAAKRDRFLGDLPAWLHASGIGFAWLYNPATWLRSVGAIAGTLGSASDAEPAALVGQFLGLGALFRAYARLLAFPFAAARQPILAGIDVSRLVRLAVAREWASPRLVSAALYADLARALARARLTPRAVVFPYENQPWEKAMLAGFRRLLPMTRMIGVQHAPLAPRYLSAHPTPRQWKDGTAPDLILTVGSEFRERLIALGAPAERVVAGGALRYAGMLARLPLGAPREPEAPKLVLATCSMQFDDSFELAHKAAVATADVPGVRLAVNFHPMVDAEFRAAIRRRLEEHVDCRHVDFVGGGAAEWLTKADLLLYTSSSTAFEAAAAGVPVVHVASDIALDLDNLLGAGTPSVRRPEDLRREMQELLQDETRRRAVIDAARAHLKRCLQVPDAKFWTDLAKNAVSDDASIRRRLAEGALPAGVSPRLAR